MTLLSVPALVACGLVLTPLLVRLLGKRAGWPLTAFFVAAAVQLARLAPNVFAAAGAGGAGSTTAVGAPPGEVLWSASWTGPLLPGGQGIDFALRLDPLSFVFTMLPLVIGSVVFIYSTAYLPPRRGTMSFYVLMTAFMLAVVLLVLADDAVLLFVGWELVSLASFMLIARSGRSGWAGSLRTLFLTFIGGLLLLAALGVATWATGTTRVSEMLADPVWSERPGLAATAATLTAFAAFSKAAQIPFHPWLPEAMAAITPVSAFLHAAAVVKAGVYLLLRFSTAFADVQAWQLILIVVGMATAVSTAFFAIAQTDIKRLTAYSTVSQLGWIVATIGVGTHFAIMAAVVHTLAHALFKSSLFMLAGVVDHEARSRDIRQLGGLAKAMPWTCGSMVVGAASMAAVPPTLGFLSKEGMLTAFEEAPLAGWGVVTLLAFAGIGALATFTYSARLVFGIFVDRHDTDRWGVEPHDLARAHEAPAALWLPAALPGVLSLPLAFVAGVIDGPLDRVAQSVLGGGWAETHLTMWHGVTVPFAISAAVLVAGVMLIVLRRPVYDWFTARILTPFTGVQALEAVQRGANRLGRLLGAPARSHSPSRHMTPILVVLSLYALVVALAPGLGGAPAAPKKPGIDRAEDLIALIVVIIGVWATIRARDRLQAAVLLGVTGTGVTVQVLLLGAPDVAMTQFLVEILTVVLIMLVLRFQPRSFPETSAKRRAGAAVVAIAAGLATFSAVWMLTGRRGKTELADWYLNHGPEVTGENNVVNTILVEFRAFDTMGELAVLGMAGIAIAAVVNSIPRHPHRAGRPGPLPEPILASQPMSMLLRWMIPILGILSLLVLWRGGNEPGGGFNGALIGAAVFMLMYLTTPADEPVVPRNAPYYLSGTGVVVAVLTGILGFAEGSFLAPLYGHVGDTHLTTALIFDVGVYLAVLGVITGSLNHLGGQTRPGSPKEGDQLPDGVIHRTGLTIPPRQAEARTARTGRDAALVPAAVPAGAPAEAAGAGAAAAGTAVPASATADTSPAADSAPGTDDAYDDDTGDPDAGTEGAAMVDDPANAADDPDNPDDPDDPGRPGTTDDKEVRR
ncbi:DUF4040 family protein [Corynebacterium sp.]|uniref:DUF4040 family protein n=1 Tax=Corynebacterium sp. TaxID=1720 RepID=UPI0026DCBF65|nr:DUF4040 family protein [Corynebacterium sp.]MDO4609548.1 DUF4040 family protein [Corynebacterium sp.]